MAAFHYDSLFANRSPSSVHSMLNSAVFTGCSMPAAICSAFCQPVGAGYVPNRRSSPRFCATLVESTEANGNRLVYSLHAIRSPCSLVRGLPFSSQITFIA